MVDVKGDGTVVLSLIDVARRLGVTVKTVRNWSKPSTSPQRPQLETAKAGGKVITTEEALQRFIRQQNGEATPATTFTESQQRFGEAHQAAKERLRKKLGI